MTLHSPWVQVPLPLLFVHATNHCILTTFQPSVPVTFPGIGTYATQTFLPTHQLEMEEASSHRHSVPSGLAMHYPAPLPAKYQSPVHPQAPAEPSPVFVRASVNFKPPSNDPVGRSVLLERDRNEGVSVLWHGSSSKFSSAMVDRFYKDNSLDKARKLKETPTEVKVEKARVGRLARIHQQKEELEAIRNRQKTMKSRIKQFIEERLELEQKFEASAVIVQKHIRGFLARKRVVAWMYEREKQRLGELLGMMQKQINCFWTGTGEQANNSATRIQALYRGFRVRVGIKRRQKEAAQQELATRRRTAAATLIQQSYRSYMTVKRARLSALESIRKRLLVLKLKYFWHKHKLYWACMRKKYRVDQPTVPALPPAQLLPPEPPLQRRPSSAKRTGGGFVTDLVKSRGLSIDPKLELTAPLPPLTGTASVVSKQGEQKPVPISVPVPKPQTEVKRPTVPLIPRPRERPPRAPKADEDVRQQTVALATVQQETKRPITRSYSDSPPKYLQPTTSFKYRTGVDASIDMPSKGRKRHRKVHDSTLNRPTISRQQYVQESSEHRARSADPRERNWRPTVGVTTEVKALPAIERAPPKLPSYLLSEEEEEAVVASQGMLERVEENGGRELAVVEKEYVYRPQTKQSLDFKEALPEYHDFLQKYGKNLKPDSTPRPDTNRSSASFRSDSLRITPRTSAKKVEL